MNIKGYLITKNRFLGLLSLFTLSLLVGQKFISLQTPSELFPVDIKSTTQTAGVLNDLYKSTPLSNINNAGWGEKPSTNVTALSDSQEGIWVFRSNAKELQNDRFDLTLEGEIYPIYGLGRVVSPAPAELANFTDKDFGFGHLTYSGGYQGDKGRMQTPVFILPTKNLIIAYLQPEVNMLRLTRAGGKTTLVLKKSPYYNSGEKGNLVIIKGKNIEDTYSKYYEFLKNSRNNNLNVFFKKPHYNVFGLYWETYAQFGCSPTLAGVKKVVDSYSAKKLPLSMITIGSGYWDSNDLSGCGATDVAQGTTTDTFKLSEKRMGSLTTFNKQISNWKKQGIYTTIGFRHLLAQDSAHIASVISLLKNKYSVNQLLLSPNVYTGERPSNNVYMINLKNPELVKDFMNLARSRYGNFQGIKEDDMLYSNQAKEGKGTPNFDPTLIGLASKTYSKMFNNDFIVMGSNNLFGVPSDAQYSQGYVSAMPSAKDYYFKYLLSSMFSQVFSGYPHPIMETHAYPCNPLWGGDEKMALRNYQLTTFLPVTQHSCGYDNFKDKKMVSAIDWFAALRIRLHRYSYDNAMTWYSTGVPTLMRPLVLDNDWQNDPTVKQMYSDNIKDSSVETKNEFMYGNALLVRPVFNSIDKVKVYLPAGKWRSFITASSTYNGGNTYEFNLSGNYINYPVFIKEKEILLIAPTTTSKDIQAYVFFDNPESNNNLRSSTYRYYVVDNSPSNNKYTELVAYKSNGKFYIENLSSKKKVEMTDDNYGKGFKIATINSILSSTHLLNSLSH